MRLRDLFDRTGRQHRRTEFSLRTVEVDAADVSTHPGLLARLEDRQIDAVLIRGVLSPDEVRAAVEGLDAARHHATDEMFGQVLGMPLLRLGDGQTDRTPYFDATDIARRRYRDAFGFDPHDRVAAAFEALSAGLPIEVPEEAGRSYSPGTARWYLPGQGGLYPHVGNEFVAQNEHGALTHLLTVNQVRDWMSWFMVLRRPDRGGTLTVYDLLHAERPATIDDPDERGRLFADLASVTYDPGPGDVIVFCGGWRYHRVEDIEGDVSRITYGGFMRPSRDRSALHMWS